MALEGAAPQLQLFCLILPGPDPCPAQGTDKQTAAHTTLAILSSTCPGKPFLSARSLGSPSYLPLDAT